MRESIKVICVAVLLFGVPTAVIVWMDDRPSDTVWIVRLVSSIGSVGALALFLKMHFRRDVAPDFLRQNAGNYFNRAGFCFAFGALDIDGVLYLQAYFQNQFERPCRGRIALRPSRGFFMNRPGIEAVSFDIECAGAGYGEARVPVPLSQAFHGKRVKFDVGASVEYPGGKGRQLRFRDGIVLRSDAAFKNAFGSALTTAGALTGSIVLSRPAGVKLEMPIGVAEDLPESAVPIVRTLWKLGDP